MPGPKMGPRPADFNEAVIRQSPTFMKWMQLQKGQKLRYACREFIKDNGDDEERLMRRIMIARRNNIRDHETLKKARRKRDTLELQEQDSTVPTAVPPNNNSASIAATAAAVAQAAAMGMGLAAANVAVNHRPGAGGGGGAGAPVVTASPLVSRRRVQQQPATAAPAPSTSTASTPATRRRRPAHSFSDAQVEQEMDKEAVEATRSYRAWADLAHGAEFVYNQKYVKGKEGHDWLLRKNIWRRMRYRRENKKMVERMKLEGETGAAGEDGGEQSYEPFAVLDEAPQEMAALAAAAATEDAVAAAVEDHALAAAAAAAAVAAGTKRPHDSLLNEEDEDHVVRAAVAAAECFKAGSSTPTSGVPVVDPTVASVVQLTDSELMVDDNDAASAVGVGNEALDAAARLAAATCPLDEDAEDAAADLYLKQGADIEEVEV